MTLLNVRLRPTRFAFLVPPGDMNSVQRVFEMNTCLWGGQFNPIIPFVTKRPAWWDRQPSSETAEQIINGYLDYFEPDILVVTNEEQAKGLGFDHRRVLHLDELMAEHASPQEPGQHWPHGLSIEVLYRDLFRRQFQFTRRDPQRIVRITPGSSRHAALAACIFGKLPESEGYTYLARGFDRVFSPDEVVLTPATAREIFEEHWADPIGITTTDLKVRYPSRPDPCLFVFDGTKPGDLIDYWNLRAGVMRAVPIPVQFLEQLGPFARDFIRRNYRPLPGNRNGVMIRPKVMFARSIDSDAIEPMFKQHFMIEVEGANTLQTWYPTFWRPASDFGFAPLRPVVSAREETRSVTVEDQQTVIFDGLEPSFPDLPPGEARWANVVTLLGGIFEGSFAAVYPDDYRDPKVPPFTSGSRRVLPTTEGFVALASLGASRHYWTFEHESAAIARWLGSKGVKSSVSGSGRSTQQLIQTMKGFRGVSALASEEIVKLLDGMSRKPGSKSMEHNQFRNRINKAVKESIWHRDAFGTLVDRKAVEIGLEVACQKCGNWSWYALADIAASLTCQLCLKQYAFPAAAPGDSRHTRWAYRLLGAFAQPNFAQGAYAAALAMRVFAEIVAHDHDARLTWSAGLEMTLAGGQELEADFILWYRRPKTFGSNQSTHLVFGEAKSFGQDAFTAVDVARMKDLALAFPGAALVFATMRDVSQLSKDEIRRLTELARWGRHYEAKRRQVRAPVIVLTGTELFAEHALEDTWKKKGGLHAELVSPGYVRTDNLYQLADMTQQLNLGMKPQWQELKEKRNFRRKIEDGPSADAEEPSCEPPGAAE
ncbi:hypothetical protein [Sphingobium yanoikuyae]|uniref:Uncharacterized protein n=1 Tax=Sphingobium yanoikuyae TaxID=13690 RepID=A0A3G2V2G6_SPHYA|nr:hypothetical protein [Sphingobium yanoikuyae]AYO78909.1 hypothetical protein EBF16_19670 [Sphingobium yanoikuyae]